MKKVFVLLSVIIVFSMLVLSVASDQSLSPLLITDLEPADIPDSDQVILTINATHASSVVIEASSDFEYYGYEVRDPRDPNRIDPGTGHLDLTIKLLGARGYSTHIYNVASDPTVPVQVSINGLRRLSATPPKVVVEEGVLFTVAEDAVGSAEFLFALPEEFCPEPVKYDGKAIFRLNSHNRDGRMFFNSAVTHGRDIYLSGSFWKDGAPASSAAILTTGDVDTIITMIGGIERRALRFSGDLAPKGGIKGRGYFDMLFVVD